MIPLPCVPLETLSTLFILPNNPHQAKTGDMMTKTNMDIMITTIMTTMKIGDKAKAGLAGIHT